MNWLQKNKWKVIAPAVILAVLAFAFWYGSDTPGARGWTVAQPTIQTETPPETTETAAPTTVETLAEPTLETAAETMAASQQQKAADAVAGLIDVIGDVRLDSEGLIKAARAAFNALSGEEKLLVANQQLLLDAESVLAGLKTAARETQQTADENVGTGWDDDWEEETEETRHVCYLSITCNTILNNMDLCDPAKEDFVPFDGVILWEAELEFTPGESVFDVLQRACWDYGIHMESEWTPMYNSAYIEGINNLYEFDVGEDSGWMYNVNGWFPNYGCSRYEVEDYDYIQWVYTCDLGSDVGGFNALG